jgi:hypothetical protein
MRIEYFQGTFEEDVEVYRFDPTKKFLKCGEVRYRGKFKSVSDTIHLFEVTDNRSIIFFPVFFEEQDSQKLMLGIISSRILTGIPGNMR